MPIIILSVLVQIRGTPNWGNNGMVSKERKEKEREPYSITVAPKEFKKKVKIC